MREWFEEGLSPIEQHERGCLLKAAIIVTTAAALTWLCGYLIGSMG